MKKQLLTGIMMIFCTYIIAQDSSKTTSNLQFSGYVETYYQIDFNNPINNTRPGFVYSHNRNNEFTLNLGFVKASYASANVRFNLTLAAGTYMNANYAAESGVMKNVYEANAGVKLSKTAGLWLDAGIFASHIGFESAISKDCRTLTRSILADNSPYYESGVRLGYTSRNEQWYLAAFILNGWQRIQRVDGNTLPAFGTQVTFKPSGAVTLNSSSFIGSDMPDSARLMRYFHNFYGIFQLGKGWEATAGFDIGAEQKTKGSSSMNSWYSPVLILRYAPDLRTAIAARGEYYVDKNGVIISTGTPNGFRTWGFSLNFDYAIAPYALWRIEAKNYGSYDAIFDKRNDALSNNNTCIATSIAISF